MAATMYAEPVEGDRADAAEMNPTNSESITAQTEEEKPGIEVTQGSEQQPGDGKSKPASEKIWGSFLKNSSLGKVMGGKKKKETGSAEANVEVQGQDKSPTHCPAPQEEGSSPPSILEGQSTNLDSPESQKQSTEKEPEKEDDEVSQEQRPSSSNKDVKPKQGEKSSVRDLIRKPVTRIFSHKSTEKKEYGADARKHKKTRSRSLDRLEDAEALAGAADPTDDVQAAGEAHRSIPHEAKHMKRWHSFKKMMSQKSVKKSTEDSKDMEGAEASVDTQADIGTLESATKLDHTGQKKWKLKRSWTFQGLKRDPSVLGIHKSKGSEKGEQITGDTDQGTAGFSEDCKLSEEGETQEREHSEQDDEKGSTQRTKSTDHHTNEMWTSFKKRVTPKSKKPVEHVTATEEEQTGEGDHGEEHVCREEGKSAKQSQKKTHFNRAVSLKNFLLRKGKSPSMDIGETTVPEQKDGGAEGASGDTDDKDGNADEGSANQTSLGDLPPEKEGNSQAEDKKGSDEEERDLSERMSPSHELKSPEITEIVNASEATSSNEAITETKICQENGSSRTGDDCSGSGAECAEQHTEGKEKKAEDTTANETALQEDGLKEVKKEDSCSQEATKQNEKTCSNILKDEENLGPEDCSGSPVEKSE